MGNSSCDPIFCMSRTSSPLLWFLCALGALPAAHASESSTIDFTPQEAAYIERARPVTLCVDPDWPPFERINEQGQHEGIAADLIQLLALRVGLKIQLVPTKTWEQSIAASQQKRCQILSFLNQTPERDQWLSFTDPIFYDQNIIVTREEHPYIGDPKGLKGETVALPRGTMVEERMRKDYPNLTILTTGSEPEAIAMVSGRKADMTVRSLIVAADAIKKEGLFNLKIAGQIPDYANKLRIGVLKDEPVLRDILDKGVKTLTAQERETIANAHVPIQVQQGIDYTLVWQVTAAGSVILLLVLYWNRKLKALNRALAHLSVTDQLTDLFNRQKLGEVFANELQRTRRFGQPFSVILLDIDHFKQVNDEHGHLTGDKVLVALARLMSSMTRETDVVGRWGGEEFLTICPHTDQAGALILAEKIREAIAAFDFPVVHHVTASLGVSSCRPDDDVDRLIARADAALYQAKREGRNRVVCVAD